MLKSLFVPLYLHRVNAAVDIRGGVRGKGKVLLKCT